MANNKKLENLHFKISYTYLPPCFTLGYFKMGDKMGTRKGQGYYKNFLK
nr:MAG TPA: hypothetical protein [Caudoviricetes sp.]